MSHSIIVPYVPLKRCTKCGEEKPATGEFFAHKTSHPERLTARCKACDAEYNRVWRQTNRARVKTYLATNSERVAKRARAYREANRKDIAEAERAYLSVNAERKAESRRAWAKKNRERIRKNERIWRELNREYVTQKRRAYATANRIRLNAHERNRKALKRNADGNHTASDIERQYGAQKGKCYYCHKRLSEKYQVEHVVPLIRGGSNGPENIVIACASCNQSKGSKLPHEWPEGNRLL